MRYPENRVDARFDAQQPVLTSFRLRNGVISLIDTPILVRFASAVSITKKSTQKQAKNKPSKLYPDYPLYPHSNGQWAKKIKQQTHYFGPWENWQDALDLYLKQKDDLHAGRKPRGERDGLRMMDLCNEFLTMCRNKMLRNEIEDRTFGEYMRFCDRIIDYFGKRSFVTDLRPSDFEEFRTSFPKNWGPVTVGKQITIARMLFGYGYDSDLIDKPVKFGPGFKKPSKKTLRQDRQTKRQKHGKKMSEKAIHKIRTRDEIRLSKSAQLYYAIDNKYPETLLIRIGSKQITAIEFGNNQASVQINGRHKLVTFWLVDK